MLIFSGDSAIRPPIRAGHRFVEEDAEELREPVMPPAILWFENLN